MKLWKLALGLLGASSLATLSAAETQQQPSVSNMLQRAQIKQVIKPNPPVSRCRVSGAGGGTIIPDGGYSPAGCMDDPSKAYLLESFRFKYVMNQDHKLKTLKLVPNPMNWNAGFGDNDGNDSAEAWATYAAVPGIRKFVARDRCLLICTIPLQPKRDDEVFVLQGFSIVGRGSDRSVRRIAISPLVGDQVEVVSPSGNIEVHYAYVPKSMVKRQYFATAYNPREQFRPMAKPGRREIDVIAGFSFRFTGGERFLHEFGMRSDGRNWLPVMKDQNHDDGMEWRMQMVRLQI